MVRSRLSPNHALIIGVAPAVCLSVGLAAFGVIDPLPAAVTIGALIAGMIWFSKFTAQTRAIPTRADDRSRSVIPHHFLENLPDPVILLNGAREIVAINRPARDLLGVGLLGRDLALTLRHPDVLAAVETVSLGVASIDVEITLPVPVARTYTLLASSLAETGDLTAPRVILVFHDETRAKRAEQSRADFVANASHELRSPLAGLIGFIETLRGHASNDPEARERFLEVMHNEALRMARLVDDLMSLSRVEINEHVAPREAVDLADVIVGVADALLVRADGKSMPIVTDCPEGLPAVTGDADQLTQVFHNLVDNAIKYGRKGTPIRITARGGEKLPGTSREAVSVAVTNEGEGIAAIHLPRLTERFYRVDEGRSRQLGGTGLGLAIAKHIVNRHRGRLMVDSEQGIGTTVTVFLPKAAAKTDGTTKIDGRAE
jgi:two-component system, OmpR family, phosphate regulon sensor histidine kinase PhoR